MLLFKNNGITKNFKKFKNKVLGPWYYEQQMIGYNFRMSDIQAALGINQLKRISKMLRQRNDIAKIYRKKLNNLPLAFQLIRKNFYSSYHLFIIKLITDNKNLHKKLFIFLRKNNIFVNLHYMPLHLNPYYKKFGYKKGNFPNSEDYGKKALSIPIFPDLKMKEQLKVINLLKKFFNVKK